MNVYEGSKLLGTIITNQSLSIEQALILIGIDPMSDDIDIDQVYLDYES